MLMLPNAFIVEMQGLFQRFGREEELASFFTSLQGNPRHGLRANTMKVSPALLKQYLIEMTGLSQDDFIPVPWSDDGFLIPDTLLPGKYPAHLAGLYYIQEPSAMLPARVLAACPGDRVLDLCAAPGGKAARITADLQDGGLLWANEISAERVRALLRNIELTGSRRTVLTQESPEHLARQLPETFDRILVDAPCSGSGMFRRDPAAVRSWSAYGSTACIPMQKEILAAAWVMLRPGGRLVYSTCTFSIAENEEMVGWLLDQYKDARLLPISKTEGVDDGFPLREEMTATARIWPHRSPGEGHFCALLEKASPASGTAQLFEAAADISAWLPEAGPDAVWSAFWAFCRQTLTAAGTESMNQAFASGHRRHENGHLHLLPDCPAGLSRLKKVKTGLFLGQVRSLRHNGYVFEPSQALLLSLKAEDLLNHVVCRGDCDQIRRYLRGETIAQDQSAGQDPWPAGRYGAVLLDGGADLWPLGWVRAISPPVLKNLFPPGWRRSS